MDYLENISNENISLHLRVSQSHSQRKRSELKKNVFIAKEESKDKEEKNKALELLFYVLNPFLPSLYKKSINVNYHQHGRVSILYHHHKFIYYFKVTSLIYLKKLMEFD